MRLRKVEALRYGAMTDSALGELGDGLTVVLGPNEAGKSTFTSLVRHVLYGFPRRGESAGAYRPADGDRRGRLVFQDGAGRWVLERTDGPNGGVPRLTSSPSGESGEEFAARITAGVSDATFQQVFGFSLAELTNAAGLESISGRLTATVAGLSVNCQTVIDELDAEAAAIWKPGTSKPVVNALAREIKDGRAELRELDAQTASRAEETRRLEQLAVAVQEAERVSRDSARREGTLRETVVRLAALEERDRALATEAAEASIRRTRLADEREAVPDGAAVLENAAAVDELVDGQAAFERAVERLDEAAEARATASARSKAALATLGAGWDEERLATVSIDVGSEGQLDALADELGAAEAAQRSSAERAARSRAAADAAAARSKAAAAEVRAASTRSGGGPATPARRPLGIPILAGVVSVTGLAMLFWGWTAHEPVALALAAVVALAGLAALVVSLIRPGAPAPAASDALAETVAADRAGRAADDAERSLDEARQDAVALATADSRLEGARDAWLAWLVATGLSGAPVPPASARALLRAVAECRSALADREEAMRHLGAASADTDAYRASARAAGVITRTDAPLSEVGSAVRAAAAAAVEARAEEERALTLEREIAEARADETTAAEAREALAEERGRLLAATGMPAEASDQDVAGEAQVSADEADRDREALTTMREEAAGLAGELNVGDPAEAAARVRARLEALTRHALDSAERYAVLAVARTLVADALDRYRRDRQPAVLREASRLFSLMTAERYVKVDTELGSFAPYVLTGSDARKDVTELSTATREQLYLALRIAYIQLDLAQADPALPVFMDDILVNFDDERAALTIGAIGRLAEQRQTVFFTCRPATVRAFEDASATHTLVRLDRCAL